MGERVDMVKKRENITNKTLSERQGKAIVLLTILSIALFLCANYVSAVPPVTTTQQFIEGYTIQIPQDNIIKIGQPYNFEFHVFNISNGVPKISGISCDLHLYNELGDNLFVGTDNTADLYGDYTFNLSKGNFTKTENYYYYVRCNSSTLGGFAESILRINYTGEEIQSDLIVVLFIIAFVVIIGFSIYEMYMMITHVFLIEYDVIDFAKAGGIYFAILGLNLMHANFLGNPDLSTWFTLFIQIGLWTNIIIPAMALAFTLMLGDWIKLNRLNKANG